MRVLRTPDDRFVDLPDYPFGPKYLMLDDLRMHYVDVGPPAAAPILLLHGEPSWSFLYRHMIPLLVAAGYRAVAPDLIGFGRSDKPAERSDYTYQRHVDWMTAFVQTLDLRDITLVCQDWGSLIGLRVAAEQPNRFGRIVLSNGGLPTGDQPMPEAFKRWQQLSQTIPELPVGQIINGGCVSKLSAAVVAAYDAPFPDESYKAGARVFPALVPTTPDDPAAPAVRAAWEQLRHWHKPFLTAFSDSDPITHGGERVFQKLVPGAQNQPHTTIANAGHFVQEDRGPEFARIVLDFIASTEENT